jgi:ABC-type thiamine transport system substrate-binding protein
MVSPEYQEKIALTNIMYPARHDIPLPSSFSTLPKVDVDID